MNNSDYNDFNNWQNGDEFEMNNPNNHMHGFFFFDNPNFKKLWEQIQNGENPSESLQKYFHMDSLKKHREKYEENKKKMERLKKMESENKNSRNRKQKTTTFTQEEYLKLIEIRGYLAITEQFPHVKALDKLLNQIAIVPPEAQ